MKIYIQIWPFSLYLVDFVYAFYSADRFSWRTKGTQILIVASQQVKSK